MISFRIFFINLFHFYLIFSEDLRGCCFVPVWQPLSPNIASLLAVNGKQSLTVSWMVNHSDLVDHIDEIQVSRTEDHIIIYSENVSIPADVAEYTWTWTSDLPLECVDHSVRIRHFYNESVQSPWSSWTTNPGVKPQDKTEAFPFQRVLREGTSAMFCCVPPPGVNIINMTLRKETYPLISIGTRVKAIAIDNLKPAKFKLLILQCSDTTNNPSFTENFASSPPLKLINLMCVISDMITVTCTWDTSGKQDIGHYNIQTQTLHIDNIDHDPIPCQELSCTFPAIPHVEEYNIRVVVKNQLGEETESHRFNISDRVFPIVDWDTLRPDVTHATVSWIVHGNLTQLNLLCQVTTDPHSTTELRCNSVNSRCKVKLEHLLPNTHYSAKVRCSANGRFWGKWTQLRPFKTKPLVTLNLWRKIQQLSNLSSRQVTLLWIPHVPGSATTVNIQSYTIQWSQEGQNRTQTEDSASTQTEVYVGLGEYDFRVQAVLLRGLSIPAHITIPKRNDRESIVAENQLSSSTVGGFSLSWAQQVTATCGYTVEWYIQMPTALPTLQWMKTPQGNNTLILPDRNFKAGCRYTFNIYECTESGHRLLEIQNGYSRELEPVENPSLVEPVQSNSSSVTLEWHYNEADPAHLGFIIGYLVTVQDTLSGHTTNVTVEDPQRKSVTIKNLQQNHEYALSVSALTMKGPGPPATVTTRTPRINFSGYLANILTSIFLLVGCIVILWPQRKMLKNGVKKIFAYPAGMDIKISELQTFLNETGVTLVSHKIEECISCDIEILNTSFSLGDTAAPSDSEPISALASSGVHPCPPSSCMLLEAGYCPQSATLLCDTQMICITNKSYIPSMVEDASVPQNVRLSEIKSSFEPSNCLQKSVCVEYGYISSDNL